MASKLVLVTGASSGIGAATAKLYGASGAHVLLLARNETKLDEVAAAIRRDGGAASPYAVDLADASAIAETSARIKREAGTPDILINNAGAGRWLSVLETSAEEALAMIEVPYLAAFNLTRAFLPEMIARGSGAIACITSPASYVVWPNAAAYTAARHALLGFTESLRADLRSEPASMSLSSCLARSRPAIGSTIPAAASTCPSRIRSSRRSSPPNKPPRRSFRAWSGGSAAWSSRRSCARCFC